MAIFQKTTNKETIENVTIKVTPLRDTIDAYNATVIVLENLNNTAKSNEGAYDNVISPVQKQQIYDKIKYFTDIKHKLLEIMEKKVSNYDME